MYTFPSAYSTALASPFKENWLVRLYKSDGTYIGISFSTVTMDDSKTYTGSILNSPSIRDEVDFSTGSASTGNMSLEVADHNVSSTKLSELLFTGNYVNRDVKVYSNLNTNTAFANTLQIFTGRLASIDLTERESIKLQIIVKRPWDNVKIPNELSDNNIYKPVIYGSYTDNTYRDTTNAELAPLPFLTSNSIYLWYASHSSTNNVLPHYYDSTSKSFPLLSRASNASSTVEGIDAIRILDTITRTYRIKGGIDSTDPGEFVSGSTSVSNAVDSSVSTFSQSTLSVNDSSANHSIVVNLPQFSGKVIALVMYLKWDISYLDSEQSPSHFVKFTYNTTYDSTVSAYNIVNDTSPNTVPSSAETATSSGHPDINNSNTAHSQYNLSSIVSSNDNKVPDLLTFKHEISQTNNSSNNTLDSTLKLYDIWFNVTVQTDTENEPNSAGQEKARLDRVYVAHNGFTKSWQPGIAQKPHDIHRDLLHRFLGLTATPDGYTALDNEKNGVMRFFTEPNKAKPIKSYLDEISKEGGFVFRFRADDTPIYHFIPNSPSTDISLTHNDIDDLRIGHTGLQETVTQFTVQFNKNPAEDKYKDKTTHTTSTRTNLYPSGSKENIKEIKLQYLSSAVEKVSGNRNDSYLNYYADVIGELKQLLTFDIVNPTKSNIEVGDIIDFSSMSINPLSGDWSSVKFIVTSTNRTVGGKISVQAREI